MKKRNYAEKILSRKLRQKQTRDKSNNLSRDGITSWLWVLTILLIFLAIFLLMPDYSFSEEWLKNRSLLLSITCLVVILLLVILAALPKIYVKSLQKTPLNINQSEFDREKESLKLEDDARKTLAQIIGGAVFLLGLIFTYNSFVLSREGQLTDRFTKAVSQLGDKDIAVRLGGLYALERIAKDSPRDHWTIIEIISSYIREKSPNKKPARVFSEKDLIEGKTPAELEASAKKVTLKNEKISIDVQAALTIIGRRISKQDPFDGRIDLHSTNLKLADLSAADLHGGNLENSDLSGASLDNANLSNAILSGIDLSYASLQKADLRRSILGGANFSNTTLYHAKLNTVFFDGSIFDEALFTRADLTGASLGSTNLVGAKELTFEQLESAIINTYTQLPGNLENRRQELLSISSEKRFELLMPNAPR